MHAGGSHLAGSDDRSGGLAAVVWAPLAEVYLEFLAGRCRPNTVRAAAYDLKVFFTVVAKPPEQVRPADVLAFITAQRTGRVGESGVLQPVDAGREPGGVSAATVRRRLSIVSGFFAFLQARGDVVANPVPRGLPTRRERSRPRQGVPLVRVTRRLPRVLSPAEVDTPEKRLRHYARQFGLVEVDATYYALPAEQTAALWAARTPDGFTFNIKAFSLFTHHPTPVAALPVDLRPAAAKTGKDRVYFKDVGPVVAEEAWQRFSAALEPLRAAGKLGAILLQFPPWFPISKARKDYIVACAARAAPDRVCIEFRNRTWMTPENQDETLGFLTGHRLPYVCVDMPQGHRDSIPPVLAVTSSDLAVVRMHGHSGKWDSKDIHERFGYRYTEAELTEWAPKVRALARDAEQTHVLFNNCYRNYAQVNAQQLAGLLQP